MEYLTFSYRIVEILWLQHSVHRQTRAMTISGTTGSLNPLCCSFKENCTIANLLSQTKYSGTTLWTCRLTFSDFLSETLRSALQRERKEEMGEKQGWRRLVKHVGLWDVHGPKAPRFSPYYSKQIGSCFLPLFVSAYFVIKKCVAVTSGSIGWTLLPFFKFSFEK